MRGAGIRLGTNWGKLESYQGLTFRWVANGAVILLTPAAARRELAVDLEPGPGIRTLPMQLEIHTANGSTMRELAGRTLVEIQPGGSTVTLSARNGGNTIASDPRILNFRAFSVGFAPSPPALADEVAAPGIHLGANWGVVEHYGGQTFRWIDNDAEFTVPSGPHRLAVTLEGGPGIGPIPFQLDVYAGAKLVASVPVKPRQETITVPLPATSAQLRLHAEGGGKHVPSDPRVLNFRVFRIGLANA